MQFDRSHIPIRQDQGPFLNLASASEALGRRMLIDSTTPGSEAAQSIYELRGASALQSGYRASSSAKRPKANFLNRL